MKMFSRRQSIAQSCRISSAMVTGHSSKMDFRALSKIIIACANAQYDSALLFCVNVFRDAETKVLCSCIMLTVNCSLFQVYRPLLHDNSSVLDTVGFFGNGPFLLGPHRHSSRQTPDLGWRGNLVDCRCCFVNIR